MVALSVVIPFHNAERWLRTPIESVLGQDHPAEIIAVDDGSTDSSGAIAASYGDRVRVITKANRGVASARNAGLRVATGDYVIFLDADDYFDGQLLSGVAAAAVREPTDLIFSPGGADSPRGMRPHRHTREWPRMDRIAIATSVANGRTTPVNAQAWRRGYLLEVGGYRDYVRLREDTELLLRALVGGASFAFNEAGLAIWVIRPHEMSQHKRRDEPSLASTHRWHAEHVALPAVRQHRELLHAYALRSYGTASVAFEEGYLALGREALALARDCGLTGHPGGRAHRVLATVLGLERKVRIARSWRSLRRAAGFAKNPPQRRRARLDG